MQAEPLAIYCPRCDSAYSYYPDIPEHCWNCGAAFAESATPNVEKPVDHFPIVSSLMTGLAVLGGAIAGGIAVHGWEHRS